MCSFACVVGLLLAGTQVVAQSHEKRATAAATAKSAAAGVTKPQAATAGKLPAAAKTPVAMTPKPSISEARHAAIVEPVKTPGVPAKVTNPDAELFRVAKAVAAGFAAAGPAARAAAARASAMAVASQPDAQATPRRQTATRPGPRHLVHWPAVNERWQLGWPLSTPASVRLAWPVDDTVAHR